MTGKRYGIHCCLNQEWPKRNSRYAWRRTAMFSLSREKDQESEIRDSHQPSIYGKDLVTVTWTWNIQTARTCCNLAEKSARPVAVFNINKGIWGQIAHLNPSLLVISYKIPHSLLSRTPETESFGVETVEIPVGFWSSSSNSRIKCSGTPTECIWAWNVNGQDVLGVSSFKVNISVLAIEAKRYNVPFPDASVSITPASIRFFSLSILAWSSGPIMWAVSFLTTSGTSAGNSRISILRLRYLC